MRKKIELTDDFFLAMYLLKSKFNTVDDLLRFWSFSGPCLETHPSIEDYKNSK